VELEVRKRLLARRLKFDSRRETKCYSHFLYNIKSTSAFSQPCISSYPVDSPYIFEVKAVEA